MVEIIIIESKIRFKNPNVGQRTRAIEEHYNGRRIRALVDGEEKMFRFTKSELTFTAEESDIEEAILNNIQRDN